MMIKTIFTLGLAALGTFLLPTSCIDHEPIPEETYIRPGTPFDRTVLVYMAAQNSLGAKGYAQQDSTEMANGMQYLRKGERVLMFLDDNRPPRLYELRQGLKRPRLLRQWETDVNSADPKQLTEMLQFMQTFSPSTSYGLVLWSHATGWVPSPKSVAAAENTASAAAFSPLPSHNIAAGATHEQLTRNNLWWSDSEMPSSGHTSPTSTATTQVRSRRGSGVKTQSYGMDVGPDGNWARDVAALGGNADEINIDDLEQAIQNSGIHLRFLHFDCCLMGGIETYYALRNVADYIAGSPMEISAIGGFYTDMLRWGYFSENIEDLGTTYTNYYINRGSQSYGDNFGLVFSIVRTDRLQGVADALAAELPTQLPAVEKNGALQYPDVEQAQDYSRYSQRFFWRPHYYDMNDVLRRTFSPESWQRVKRALDAATVYKFATPRFFTGLTYYDEIYVDLNNYCGISMFVPQQTYTDHATARPPFWVRASAHGDLNAQFRKTEWYKAAGWQAAGW